MSIILPKGENAVKLPEAGYKRDFVIFGYFVIILTLTALVGAVVVKLLLPFVAAWLIALLLRPVVARTVEKTGWSKKGAGIFVFFLIIILASSIVFLLFRRVYTELRALNIYIGENYEDIAAKVADLIKNITEKFRIDGSPDSTYIYNMLVDTVRSSLADLTAKITDTVGEILGALPYFFFTLIIFLMAAYYFCSDFDRINKAVISGLPKRVVPSWKGVQKKVLAAALKYVKAYVILFLITFVALMIAFIIVGEKYATLLAAVIALLDILPVIGVGTVLIPWVIVLFALGQVKKAIVLTVVCAVVMIGRQILEPHIVGTQLGVHPLLTLVSVFAGYKLFGLLGFIIGPIAVVVIKNLLELVINNKNTA
ncbi:MAG: sporulation integral membrane protein YtvI [Ruminococcaceae bacterium]|nr:sporulation integral membrane protein YtvI [Oscillospiraceae bacterium]